METEFIYYRHTTPIGVRIEEITGYEQLSGPNWVAFAKQVFSENSKDGYRVIDHYDSGAPFLDGESSLPYLKLLKSICRFSTLAQHLVSMLSQTLVNRCLRFVIATSAMKN